VNSVAAIGHIKGTAVTWLLPQEVPVAVLINSESYAVMMATPADMEDFAVGFALSEGLVLTATHISNVLVLPAEQGFSVDLAIAEDYLIRERMIMRSMEGRVGCGLCGIEDMADAIRMPNGKLKPYRFNTAAVEAAFAALPDHQPMNAVNHTVHAAAFCSVYGEIVEAREDVGRHNALDKLIGAMARRGIIATGFVVMSSRCSFELVQKCASVGISALATLSAPTALSLAAHSKAGVMIFEDEQNEFA
jgi:FdhD protein